MEFKGLIKKSATYLLIILVAGIFTAIGIKDRLDSYLQERFGFEIEKILPNHEKHSAFKKEPSPKMSRQKSSLIEANELKENEVEKSFSEKLPIGYTKREQEVSAWNSRVERLANNMEHYKIKVVNKCDKKIYLAIEYLDLENNWVTEGLWGIDAYEESFPNIKTQNQKIYLYAYSSDGQQWNGNKKSNSLPGYIAANKFTRLSIDDKLEDLDGAQYVSFFLVNMGSNWNYTQSFSCNE